MHSDGSLCDGPIALAEVQGYVYAAYRRLGPLLKALGKPRQAELLRGQAARLRQRFNRKFWLSNHAPPMALDGQKQPAEVMSSNAGQLLWSGILSRRRANDTRAALFENDMFSGWGIRTLSANASAYNPLGYHVGTVWPHDNGIIAQGLKRYGYEDEVNEIATALFDAARQFPSYRLPELFGGQPRTEFGQPVPYPVACRPQAWTAGSWLHLLQAILGIVPDAANHRLFLVRPELPFWLSDVHLQGIKVGQGCVNLHFYKSSGRTRVLATGADGIEVKRLSSWPRSDPKSGGNLDS